MITLDTKVEKTPPPAGRSVVYISYNTLKGAAKMKLGPAWERPGHQRRAGPSRVAGERPPRSAFRHCPGHPRGKVAWRPPR